MPLSSVFFRGDDSTGSMLVRSTLPSYNPLWFSSNQLALTWRSRAPRTTAWHHGNLLSHDSSRKSQEPPSSPAAVFGLLVERRLLLSSGMFLCSRMWKRAAGTCGSQAGAQRTLHATNSTCNAPSPLSLHKQRAGDDPLHLSTSARLGGTLCEHIWRVPILFTQWKPHGMEGWTALKPQISRHFQQGNRSLFVTWYNLNCWMVVPYQSKHTNQQTNQFTIIW